MKINGQIIEIELTEDLMGFTGMPVVVHYKCSVEIWNRIIGTEFKFPNGSVGTAYQPILNTSSNYDMIKGIRFNPVWHEMRLGGKKGEVITAEICPEKKEHL